MPERDGNRLDDRVLKVPRGFRPADFRALPKAPGEPPRVRHLKKPFFPSELIGPLRELLGRKETNRATIEPPGRKGVEKGKNKIKT